MPPPMTQREAKEAKRRALMKHNLEVAIAELDDINACLEDMQLNVKSVCTEVVRLQAEARAEQRKRAREAAAAKAADKARVEKLMASHHENMKQQHSQHAKAVESSSSKSNQNHIIATRRTTVVPKKRKTQNLVPLVFETIPEDCSEKSGSSKQ